VVVGHGAKDRGARNLLSFAAKVSTSTKNDGSQVSITIWFAAFKVLQCTMGYHSTGAKLPCFARQWCRLGLEKPAIRQSDSGQKGPEFC
jgi:hypothetical protein